MTQVLEAARGRQPYGRTRWTEPAAVRTASMIRSPEWTQVARRREVSLVPPKLLELCYPCAIRLDLGEENILKDSLVGVYLPAQVILLMMTAARWLIYSGITAQPSERAMPAAMGSSNVHKA